MSLRPDEEHKRRAATSFRCRTRGLRRDREEGSHDCDETEEDQGGRETHGRNISDLSRTLQAVTRVVRLAGLRDFTRGHEAGPLRKGRPAGMDEQTYVATEVEGESEGRSTPHEHQADDGARTRDTWLGKPVLYQLSYVRDACIVSVLRVSPAARPRRTAPVTSSSRMGTSPPPIGGQSREEGLDVDLGLDTHHPADRAVARRLRL